MTLFAFTPLFLFGPSLSIFAFGDVPFLILQVIFCSIQSPISVPPSSPLACFLD